MFAFKPVGGVYKGRYRWASMIADPADAGSVPATRHCKGTYSEGGSATPTWQLTSRDKQG